MTNYSLFKTLGNNLEYIRNKTVKVWANLTNRKFYGQIAFLMRCVQHLIKKLFDNII